VSGLDERIQKLIDNIECVMVGKRRAIELTVMTLLGGGHALIEDVPGTGKTMLARAQARSIGGEFKRIQFTPDLMPMDVTGVSIWSYKTKQMEFRPGPLFSNIVLADEINRATPKAQSALLEAMGEGQVTVDGITYRLPEPFFVIATQNPLEYEGTFPLPEAQLDRFWVRLNMGARLTAEELFRLMQRVEKTHPVSDLSPVLTVEEVRQLQGMVREFYCDGAVRHYIAHIIKATQEDSRLRNGASERSADIMQTAAKAYSMIRGGDFVTPQHVQDIAVPILAHRVILSQKAMGFGDAVERTRRAEEVVSDIVKNVPLPGSA